MSSAILYLAIVAIWACILVPRFVRRTHTTVQAAPVLAAGDVTANDVTASDVTVGGPGAEASAAAAAVSGTLDAGPDGQAGGLEGSWRTAAEPLDDDSPAPGSASSDGVRSDSDPSDSERWDSERWDSEQRESGPSDEARSESDTARPRLSRSAILQARRRMMTMLVTLGIAAIACMAARLTPWWTSVPPAGMLGMYVLLLREAARADAEIHSRRLEAGRAHRARQRAREAWAARETWMAREPEPTAQVIDISGRVRDQLYDQYADATMRAVGD